MKKSYLAPALLIFTVCLSGCNVPLTSPEITSNAPKITSNIETPMPSESLKPTATPKHSKTYNEFIL